jgi:hypothetical protein
VPVRPDRVAAVRSSWSLSPAYHGTRQKVGLAVVDAVAIDRDRVQLALHEPSEADIYL